MRKQFRIIIFTLSMYIITHLFVFAVLPFAILVSFLDKNRIPGLKGWFVRCLFRIVGKELKVSGYEKVDPQQAYLIIANYPSFYAGFSLIGAFPDAAIVAHAFTKKVPLLGQVLDRLGAVFVQPGRGGRGIQAIDLHLQKNAASRSMIILPEGERTADGEVHRFRRGFIRILRQTSLDLLPVTLNGFYQLKPVKRFHLDPQAEIEMVIHPPVPNALTRQMSDEELSTTARNIILEAYRP